MMHLRMADPATPSRSRREAPHRLRVRGFCRDAGSQRNLGNRAARPPLPRALERGRSGAAAVYADPPVGGESPSPTIGQTPPGPGATAGSGPGPATKCKVKSFGMTFDNWNTSWPGRLDKSTTIRLPVEFDLRLASGSRRGDCLVGQDKRGQVETGGVVADSFPTWVSDSHVGRRYWWDGSTWTAAHGAWDVNPFDWFDEHAVFKDEPGFNSDPGPYPLYWGGFGHTGHFEFSTYVMDKASSALVRRLTWGLLIDYSTPKKGRRYFYT